MTLEQEETPPARPLGPVVEPRPARPMAGGLTRILSVIATLTLAGSAIGAAIYSAQSADQARNRDRALSALIRSREDVLELEGAVQAFVQERRSKGFVDTAPPNWSDLNNYERLDTGLRRVAGDVSDLEARFPDEVRVKPHLTPLVEMSYSIGVVRLAALLKLGFGQETIHNTEADGFAHFLDWVEKEQVELISYHPWWLPFTQANGMPPRAQLDEEPEATPSVGG